MNTADNTANNNNAVDLVKADEAPELPPHTVTLDEPLTRGANVITHVTLRKPTAGDLRGTTLNALANLDVDAMRKVLPRITNPTLTEADISRLAPADLMQLGGEFADFLLPKAQKALLD